MKSEMQQAQGWAKSREPVIVKNAHLEDEEVTSFDEDAQLL